MDGKMILWLNEGIRMRDILDKKRYGVGNQTLEAMEEFSKGNRVAVTNYIMSLYLKHDQNNIPREFLNIITADEDEFYKSVYSFFVGLHSKKL